MDRFIGLRDGKIQWSSTVQEWLREHEKPSECIYCGSKKNLSTDHLFPKSFGGPDTPNNVIKACKNCNSSKGSKKLYGWIGLKNKDSIPRIAEGKYLKLLYELHQNKETLNVDKNELKEKLCLNCEISPICKKEGHEGKLTVYCLEGGYANG